MEALEGKDYSKKFEVICTLTILHGGKGARAAADEEPGILLGLHETNPTSLFDAPEKM